MFLGTQIGTKILQNNRSLSCKLNACDLQFTKFSATLYLKEIFKQFSRNFGFGATTVVLRVLLVLWSGFTPGGVWRTYGKLTKTRLVSCKANVLTLYKRNIFIYIKRQEKMFMTILSIIYYKNSLQNQFLKIG